MLKTKTKVKISVAGLMLAVSAFLPHFLGQDSSATSCSASGTTSASCTTTFQVDVQESISVSITAPDTWASGDVDTFIRNKIGLEVSTNSTSTFHAYMYSKSSTNLYNATSSTYYIPTLTSSVQKSNFASNRWGYSLDDSSYNDNPYAETDAGNTDSYYYPMSTSNIQILDGTTSGSQNIYFGAKADINQASGAYLGTVVFNVVVDSSSTDPARPTDDTPDDSTATYDASNDRTVYTTTSSNTITTAYNGTSTTTTTQVTAGDVTDLYSAAQGETRRTESNVASGSQIATGLAVAASTAAAGGMIFFILAKRREDDEEDEEELQ